MKTIQMPVWEQASVKSQAIFDQIGLVSDRADAFQINLPVTLKIFGNEMY